jgi:hypothetical protein
MTTTGRNKFFVAAASSRHYRYRFFADFFADFFAASFLPRTCGAATALPAFLFPNAASQLSEYFFDAPMRTIVTVFPFHPAIETALTLSAHA